MKSLRAKRSLVNQKASQASPSDRFPPSKISAGLAEVGREVYCPPVSRAAPRVPGVRSLVVPDVRSDERGVETETWSDS